jgi:hypothetical protein
MRDAQSARRREIQLGSRQFAAARPGADDRRRSVKLHHGVGKRLAGALRFQALRIVRRGSTPGN